MVLRNVPTAWPLLFLERRNFGYVTDSLIIFERVPGPTFPRADLEAIPEDQRDRLFRRTGRILRRSSAKASHILTPRRATGSYAQMKSLGPAQC